MKSTLMIKDLSVNKELDCQAMSAVRGGSAFGIAGGNSQIVNGGGGFASPTSGIQVGPTVTAVDASTHLDLKIPTLQNFGGNMLAVL